MDGRVSGSVCCRVFGQVSRPAPTVHVDFVERRLRFIKDEVDTMLLGRTTYQMFADYWPNATTGEDIIADDLNALSKVVSSRTLDRAPWGDQGEEATVVRDGVEAAAALKRQSGKGVVVWGSLTLAQSLMRAGLVDEFQLYFCPNVLGEGKPLFAADAGLQGMRLLGTTRYDSGVVFVRYAPGRSV